MTKCITAPDHQILAEQVLIAASLEKWRSLARFSCFFLAAIVDAEGVCESVYDYKAGNDHPLLLPTQPIWPCLPPAIHAALAIALAQPFPEVTERMLQLPLEDTEGGWLELLFKQLPVDAPGNHPSPCRVLLLIRDITAQRQSEQSLMHQDASFEKYPRGVVVCDAQQNIIEINHTFTEITGYSRADIIGQNSRIKQGPLTDPETVNQIRQALAEKRSFRGRLINYRKDGTPFWNELLIQPVLTAQGDVAYYLGLLEDVTYQLRNDEHQMIAQAVFEQVSHGLLIINPQRLLLNCNQAFTAFCGYALRDIIGIKMDNITDTGMDSWHRVLSAFAHTQEYRGEIVIQHAHGHALWCDVTLTPVLDHHHQVAFFIALIQDVTHHKQSELSLLKHESYQRALLDSFPSMIWLKDTHGKLLTANQQYLRMCGISSHMDITGKTDADCWPAEIAQQFTDRDHQVMQDHLPNMVDESLMIQGVTRWFETYRAPVLLKGAVVGSVGIAQEVTEQRRQVAYERFKFTMLEMVVQEQDAALILEKIARGIETLHPGSYCAIALAKNMGQLVQTVIAPTLPKVFLETLGQLRVEMGNGSLGTAIAIKQRVIVEDVMSHPYWLYHREAASKAGIRAGWAEPIITTGGEVLGAFGIYYQSAQIPSLEEQGLIAQAAKLVSIVLERHVSQDRIQTLAYRDLVTGLPNRRQVNEILQQMREQPLEAYHSAVIYIDLDHFKWINDAHGHALGNALLAQVAERLLTVVEHHFLACMGGDEFVVVLSGLDSNQAMAQQQMQGMQQRLQKSFGRMYKVDGQKLHITASMGMALFSASAMREVDCVKAVDIAMHKAKQAGRNTVCIYDPGMQAEIATQVMLESQLREAIVMQQLRLYYQVQVDHTGRPFGAEALLRWQHPQHGLIPPSQFIPIAEASGLIVEMGKWVIDQACIQIAEWQKDPRTSELSLSVNISARQFRQTSFISMVKSCIQRHHINPNALRLELTESVLLENVDDAVHIMTQLSQLGIQFSLDDFGTGYSSLQYLKKLPLYQLKIDRSFVHDIVTDSHDRTIVRTIIAMAQSMYLGVIAEGVETEAQMELLLNNGCRRYQGYLFGKPMPIDAFNQLLKSSFA